MWDYLESKNIVSRREAKELFIPVIVVPLVVILLHGDVREKLYHSLFGLDAEDTVGDYKSSSFDKQLYWKMHACNNGACLLLVDWRCGFSNGDEWEVSSCISEELKRADIGTNLDTIRKRCGRRHMEFVGEFHTDKERCSGVWGKVN